MLDMRFLQSSDGRPVPTDVREAWDGFVRSGAIDERRVRPTILRAWQRSVAAGCDPYQARADVLTADETIDLLRKEHRLVTIATPFLGALSRAAGSERHAAMLGDGQGRVLKIMGDPDTVADADFPRAGSLLSESVAGANGIGTALAEGTYVELVGAEHYIEGFHVFTCQGVPLHGLGGEPVGVLSMSVRRQETASQVRDILFCASEAAECELLSERLSETLGLLAPLDRILESLRQDVIQGIVMARLRFELAAREIAAGTDASATLRAAQRLIDKFRREAAVWRNLVSQGTSAVEPIALVELVEDFVALLATEARVAQIELLWKRADKLVVLDDVQALSQRLLKLFLDGLQASVPGSAMEINVIAIEGDGLVSLRSVNEGGHRTAHSTRSPLLR
jgi:sigma-54 dependent transcriptional regulator, acetoin dehydrogenase operon transcriptional activator AcoR